MNVQQVREAAEWIIGEPLLFPCGSNIRKIAEAYLTLTDPTPVTVERLVERGYVHDAIRWPGYPDVACLRRGKLYVYGAERENNQHWAWEHDDDGPSIWPVPRTVGELAMIEHLMEGR